MAGVAELIRRNHDSIMEIWREEAQKAASARGLSRPEFMNIFPGYLECLGQTKRDDLGKFSGKRRRLVENHLSTRLRQGFDIAEIIEEFAILGRAIAEICDAQPRARRPSSRDIQRFFEELGSASTAVAQMFRKHLLQDEQSEKRYLRLLQKIASEALEPSSKPFRQRLQEVLDLFMEALNAQSAAILLHDVETEQLVTAASAGKGDEVLEKYATSLDPSSFPGAVAAHDGATTADADASELTVSPGLQRVGIQSLLGVRLPPRRRLLGILYIGITENRRFTGAEIRRLETMGQHLTIHLDNARLYADLQEKIEALSLERDTRERFVSVLAHDLRTPLATARLSAGILIHHPDAPKRQAAAIRVDRNLERIDRMVTDLLDANRIRAGERLPMKAASCDLASLVREVVVELEAMYGDRFVVEAPDRLLGFWSEPQLRRTIENLASNAVKYGAAEKPIHIRIDRDRDRVSLSVHNEGTPISKADQRHLFDPSFRTRSAEAGPTKGWGLGLTLVRGSADAHGGEVTVTSDAKRGTTFRVELPIDSRPFQPNVPAEPIVDFVG